jgi:hypothetical protein
LITIFSLCHIGYKVWARLIARGAMEDTVRNIRNSLHGSHLWLDKSDDDDDTGIFEAVDSFLELSQGNTAVQVVDVCPYDEDPGNHELWDKVGRGRVGNLKSLESLCIRLNNGDGDDDEGDVSEPDWEILVRILRYISHRIILDIISGYIAGTEEMRAFARAIQGHPAITRVDTVAGGFRFESIHILCSALATLPNLEHVMLSHQTMGREEEGELGRPESITGLLRVPSLRSVEFLSFCFTYALCEATAKALKEGAAVTSLRLNVCYFPEGGSEKVASALKSNFRNLV